MRYIRRVKNKKRKGKRFGLPSYHSWSRITCARQETGTRGSHNGIGHVGARWWYRSTTFSDRWITLQIWFVSCLPCLPHQSVHGLGKSRYAKFRTGQFRPGMAFTIWTNTFCLPKTTAKAWNWYQIWLWRIGTRISVWNIPSGKTGLPFQMLRCLRCFLTFSAGTATKAVHEGCLSHLEQAQKTPEYPVTPPAGPGPPPPPRTPFTKKIR